MFKMGKFREVEIRFVALGRRVREKKIEQKYCRMDIALVLF